MKVTVLGCGPSAGVPMICNNWGECDPLEPKNRRTRSSILVEEGEDTKVLIDTSPEMRQQLLACNLQKLTAVLYTHAHADHLMGIDDLKILNWKMQRTIPVYGEKSAIDEIVRRFNYIFERPWNRRFFEEPGLKANVIEGPLHFGDLEVISFLQEHGKKQTLGYRFGDFAYSTDVSRLDEHAFACLEGVKTWVLGCASREPYPGHAHLALALEWIARVAPERAFLTHMDHTMDYGTLLSSLPANVRPAYDGMVIEC